MKEEKKLTVYQEYINLCNGKTESGQKTNYTDEEKCKKIVAYLNTLSEFQLMELSERVKDIKQLAQSFQPLLGMITICITLLTKYVGFLSYTAFLFFMSITGVSFIIPQYISKNKYETYLNYYFEHHMDHMKKKKTKKKRSAL